MEKIIVASTNKHKIIEINAITEEFGWVLVPRKQLDIEGISEIDIEETGQSFEENSLIKAKAIMELSGSPAIADDSGLEVDCLDGRPGIYSARYAGKDGDDKANNNKLLFDMKDFDINQRTGRFVSVITVVFPSGETIVARGQVEGHILFEPRGVEGFGYDPLFLPVGGTKSFGELSSKEKNKISHRSRALIELKKQLELRRL